MPTSRNPFCARRPWLPLLLVCALLLACATPAVTLTPPASTLNPPPSTLTPPPSTALPLTILYTDDEHGWMPGQEAGAGAAELLGLLQKKYNYGADPAVLLLSGGDNWTGPAISTWFFGEGMVATMNALGYSASAVGNHDFDFGLEKMKANLTAAQFPYLAANLVRTADGQLPTDLGLRPYVILDAGQLKVGVIGLSSVDTPNVTNPANIAEFEFTDYAAALRQYVPQMRAEGAQVVVLASHLCPDELLILAHAVADLQIPFMGGGHCHAGFAQRVGDTAVVVGGGNLSGYAFASLSYDPASGAVQLLDLGRQANRGGAADPTVAALVAVWQQKADAELSDVIGYLDEALPQRSAEQQALVVGAWLWSYPQADVALTNLGGLRDELPAGELTLADLISVMPFDNTLVEVHLTGAQLRQVLEHGTGSLAVGGLQRKSGYWVIDDNQTYSVLVNNYMYAGGDGYEMLARFDPDAYETGIDWRQPLIDWIVSQDSSQSHPLDAAIAALQAGQ
jgi:2',3'-cyclic-nucleotide 2'-phosphodiesterase (5'-nucleotidase family)